MASKNNQEFKTMSDLDIKNTLIESRMQLQKDEFTHAVKGLDKPSAIKDVRKKIARLETEARSRQIAAMSESELAKRSNIRAGRKSKYHLYQ